MSFGLSDHGEETLVKNGFDGLNYDVTLYLDNTDIDGDSNPEGDDLTDSDDLTAVTTEPNVPRVSKTVALSDITQINGDWGFEQSVTFDVSNTTTRVDGLLLIETGTDNIIGRAEIQDPQPGPYQDLAGLADIDLTPRVTTD
jgi:hypothetical protein